MQIHYWNDKLGKILKQLKNHMKHYDFNCFKKLTRHIKITTKLQTNHH